MRQFTHTISLSACGLLAAFVLSACGGGDASPPPVPTQTSGYAVDGYLQGAAVLCDSDGNGAPSVGEVTATSTSAGLFTFPEGCGSGMVATGGTSADTGLAFRGTLKAPGAAKVVTPLTTLLVAGLSGAELNTALGLPAETDVTSTDPAVLADGALVHSTLMKKTLAVQQLIQKTAEMLNGLTPAPDAAAMPAVYAEVASAFAEFLKSGRKLNTSDTVLDVAVVGELVKAATTRVGAAPTLGVALRDAVKAVNPGALAGVTAGGLKVQAEAILKAAATQDVTAATKVQQTDTQITDYVAANKAALAGSPTAESVTAMSKTLTGQVVASQGSGGGGADSGATGTCSAGACIDFSVAGVGLGAFGDDGGGYAAIDADPKDATNKVAKIVKRPGDQNYLGASIYTNATSKAFDPPIVLTATNNTITLRVYSSAAGEKILLKVENLPASGSAAQEVQVATTNANAWETLSFTFSAEGSYNTISVLPHFGTAVTADTTFYVDELKRPVPGTGGGGGDSGTIDFSGSQVGLGAFGDNGGGYAAIDNDPIDAANKVAKIVKKPGDMSYLGASVYTNAAGKQFNPPVALTATNNTIKLRVYSPAIGEKILLKVENLPAVGSAAQEVQVATTKANAWETLSFTFPAAGTYNTISILPHFGTTVSAETPFCFDDLTRPAPAAGGPDTTPPTVAISDNFSGATATGSVVFTFNFSESVGSSFTADDIVASGGTKGTFTLASPTQATLVVTPPATSKGTIAVSVAARTFADAAGNQNVASAAAQQAFDTTGSVGSGSGVDFGDANVGLGAFGDNGGGYAAIDADPTNAANKVAKIVKKPGDMTYLGASIYTDKVAKAYNPPVVLTSSNNTMTIRVYSPAVGEKILLKLENLPAGGSAEQQVEVTTTKAKAWETLSFTFPKSGTYNTVSILPHFGSTVSAETTFYFDDLKGPLSGGPDVTPPTVAITDNVPGATATGAVTFTFTFSEGIGTSFTADDIVVTGGAKGLFTLSSVTQATLVVTPPSAASGTIAVSVAAGKFADGAGNLNTAAVSSSQAFDTNGGGTPGTMLLSFDETVPGFSGMGAYGGALPTVVSGPTGGAGNALKIVKPSGQQPWGGVYFTVAAVPFAADRKTITARVYATRAGAVIKLKVEGSGGASVEVPGTATGAANTWSTVTWSLSAVDPTKAYTTMAITPDAELTASGQSYYIDDITLAGGSGGPDLTPPTVAITDDVPGTATGAVTFTFTFSEGVGSSFTTDDIVVTGGTKGTFTMVSSAQATLVVTPPASASGTIGVSVAAGKYADAAGNLNTAAASGTQAFDTTGSGGPGTLLLSFDETVQAYDGLGAYGGALPSVETGPTGGSGKALKILKPVNPVSWGGAYFTVAAVPFTVDRKTITARVYATRAGAVIKLKVEAAGGISAEVPSSPTGAANTWSTVTWALTAVDATKSYTTIAITPDADLVTTGASYYFDDITLSGTIGGGSKPVTIATLDEAGASLTGFEGCYDSTIADDPAGGANKVGKVVKPGSGVPFYCGTTIVTVANGGFTPIPFTSTAKTITVRLWSPTAGIPVRLKVEDIADTAKSVETETSTTKVGWQTLSFNFANPVSGTPALNLATTYNKATIFFNFGTLGTGETYYFDDITFVTGTGTNVVLVNFDERSYDGLRSEPSVLLGFGGAENSTLVGSSDGLPPGGGTGKAAKVVKNAGKVFAGTAVQRKVNDAVPTIPFVAGATKMSVRVYSSYPPGMRVHLKVEQAGRPDINSEVDAFTTVTNAWETLTFEFGPSGVHFVPSGPGPGGYQTDPTKPGYQPTAQLDPSKVYNKVNIFFDYGLGDAGYDAMPGTRTYYFDDLKFVGP